jgi:hypothetical protein
MALKDSLSLSVLIMFGDTGLCSYSTSRTSLLNCVSMLAIGTLLLTTTLGDSGLMLQMRRPGDRKKQSSSRRVRLWA